MRVLYLLQAVGRISYEFSDSNLAYWALWLCVVHYYGWKELSAEW